MSYLKALTKAAATESHVPNAERQSEWSDVRAAFRSLVAAKGANELAEASLNYLDKIEAYEDRWER